MSTALRGGHTKKSEGSSCIINELNMDRLVYNATEKYLKQGGEKVINVTPPETMPYPSELDYGIAKANNSGANRFASIHFNNVYNKEYSSAIGCEVWVYDKPTPEAIRVVNNLAKLGFKNRGVKSMVKENRTLGELKRTKMPAMIVEVCFVESRVDYNILKKVGVDAIGKAIAEGILGKTIAPKEEFYKILCYGMSKDRAIEGCERLKKEPRAFKCSYEKM